VSFREPLLLLALVLLPLAIAAYVLAQRRRKKFALRYTNIPVLATVAGRSWGRHVPAAFGLLALGCAAVRAQPSRATVAAPQRQGSVDHGHRHVGARWRPPTSRRRRLAAAQAAARALTKKLPEQFNLAGDLQQRAPVDRGADHRPRPDLRRDLRAQGAGLDRDGRRAEARAPERAHEGEGHRRADAPGAVGDRAAVRRQEHARAEPVDVADRAKKLKIPIYTIALGTQTAC
jgi:Ca-activated chloride channel family protein